MGRGGRRIGAGRKPGSPEDVGRVLTIHRPNGPVVQAAKVETGPLLDPPGDLEASAQGVWRTYAGYAVGERTLTEATAAGFREFCQQWVYLHELDKTIQRLGAGTKEAEPYFRTYLKLAQRLDSSLARFKLTAFGKPAVSENPKQAVNPWAQVAGK
jgi:hypothetical protein